MINVAGLQQARAPGQIAGQGGDAVGPQPIDQRPIADFPKAPAQELGGSDQEKFVEFVEVPFVEQEQIEGPHGACQARWQARHGDVHDVGGGNADESEAERRHAHPFRGAMGPFDRIVRPQDQ